MKERERERDREGGREKERMTGKPANQTQLSNVPAKT